MTTTDFIYGFTDLTDLTDYNGYKFYLRIYGLNEFNGL
jgi:hypothetical protein